MPYAIERTSETRILGDLEKTIVLISGPRQGGKAYLSNSLYPENFQYLNFESSGDRALLREQSGSRNRELLIFDEIHKMRDWKKWSKGIFDTEEKRPRFLATC